MLPWPHTFTPRSTRVSTRSSTPEPMATTRIPPSPYEREPLFALVKVSEFSASKIAESLIQKKRFLPYADFRVLIYLEARQTALRAASLLFSRVMGLAKTVPKERLVFRHSDGPGKTVPVRGLVLGLFLFQSYRA
jgi:hypothetical protein